MITSHIVLCGPRKSLGKRYEQLRFGESDENPHTFDLEEETLSRFIHSNYDEFGFLLIHGGSNGARSRR